MPVLVTTSMAAAQRQGKAPPVNMCLPRECAAVQMVRRSRRKRTDSVVISTAQLKNPPAGNSSWNSRHRRSASFRNRL